MLAPGSDWRPWRQRENLESKFCMVFAASCMINGQAVVSPYGNPTLPRTNPKCPCTNLLALF
jgi:hypothetical protein